MSKKQFPLVLLIAINLFFWIWFFFIRVHEVVYIDATRVLQEYKGAKAARESFEEKTGQWRLNIDTLERELRQDMLQFEEESAKMNKSTSEEKRREITVKQQQFENYRQTIQQNVQQEDQKATAEVITEINLFLKKYGEQHQYKYILIANQAGTIAYAADGLDITDEVVAALNENYGKK